MQEMKSKAIENIESKMESMDADSMRYLVLKSAKSFKSSWVELGQTLYTVWKDKLYKNWGYTEFDTYTRKEIGIRKQTALKLLRSYYFLEKEEPEYLKNEYNEKKDISAVPTLEAIDALRMASKKKVIDKNDYDSIKKKVLDEGRDVREVKKDLTQLIRQREELDPIEERRKRREALIKRFISTLRSLKNELTANKLLPVRMLDDIEKLISKLGSELR